MKVLLLVVAIVVRLSCQDCSCGDVFIDGAKDCVCGKTVFSRNNGLDDKGCCGSVQCNIDEDGRGVCVGGSVCKSEHGTWECGDTMVSTHKNCRCGGYSLTWKDYLAGARQWCYPNNEVCDYQDGGGECRNGIVVRGWHTAYNRTCANKKYLLCKTGTICVPKKEICHGTHVCKDKSDIKQCQEGNDSIYDHNHKYSKCPRTTLSGHQEYYKKEDKNNHEYNCLTRGDEDTIMDKVTSVNYTSIVPCGSSALMCGDSCLGTEFWCNPYNREQHLCGGFTTMDLVLCQNSTFWSNIDCNAIDRGAIRYFGTRCTGTLQHCYYPSHRRFDHDNGTGWRMLSCKDKSDQVFPTGCHNITDTDYEYCSSFCPEGRQTRYDNGSFFNENTGHSVLRGTKCNTKCDPGKVTTQGCIDSCSGIHNFTCNISGVEHCISDSLLCDGHPACDSAEDEDLEKCYEKLVKRKIIDDAATLYCQSSMYKSKCKSSQISNYVLLKQITDMQTVAVACNDVIQCQDAEDEFWLCTQQTYLVYAVLGKNYF